VYDIRVFYNFQDLYIHCIALKYCVIKLQTASHIFGNNVKRRCSAIAERPRCRVRYSFRRK